MRRNNRIAGRIWAAVALAMVLAWGIPAVAPAALADSAVAPAATHSTQPHVHPEDAALCAKTVELAGYPVNTKVSAGCLAGAVPVTGHIAQAIALATCGGLLIWGGVPHALTSVACGLANPLILIPSTQLCGPNSGNDCLNAWNGGPWVKVSTGGPETGDTNQQFTIIDENGNQKTSEIMFTGSGSWSGKCMGDAYNDSGNGYVSLDACALPGQGAGWGTQITWGASGCPTGEAWIKDNHWNGYLAPNGTVRGSLWVLNHPSPVCFAVIFNS